MSKLQSALSALGISEDAFAKMQDLAGITSICEDLDANHEDLEEETSFLNRESVLDFEETGFQEELLSPYMRNLKYESTKESEQHLSELAC
jgi:hypothetical protein